MRDAIILFVNGKRCEARGDAAFLTLSDWLRVERRLTGTKVVCAEGDCGACTVLLGRAGGDRPWRFDPVNACILTMAQLDGAHVLTIESVADETEGLHEVQRAMCDNHGSQCGFCTPGFVMAMLGHYEHHGERRCSRKEVANHLTGNLCRCTGYLPILDAAVDVEPSRTRSVVARHHRDEIARELDEATRESLQIHSPSHGVLFAPRSLEALLRLRAERPDARIVAGNTDLGVMVNKQKLWPAGTAREAISLHLIEALDGVSVSDGAVTIRARATLGAVERALSEVVPDFSRLLRVFASPQIKNAGTLVGNVANGSPIGDTIPSLFALGAELELSSVRGARWVPIDQFYLGYRKSALAADEVVTCVRFRAPRAQSVFKAYKICQRRDLDISFVGAAFLLEYNARRVIEAATVAYGGVGPTVLRLDAVERALLGVALDDETAWEETASLIERSVSPRSDLRGSEAGRRLLAGNLFRALGHELRGVVVHEDDSMRELEQRSFDPSLIAVHELVRAPSHDSARTHVQGKSEFVDDRPLVAGELHVGVVFSTEPHAKLVKVHTADALAAKGVVAVFTAKDVAHNLWGTIIQDQPLLADEVVRFVGEPIAVVAGETREAMELGRRLVKVEYEPLPAVLSIREALAARSFIAAERSIVTGDVDAALARAKHKRSGTVKIQGQDHFYLESHCSIAYPKDDGQVEIHASSQHPTEVQHVVAHGLGLPAHSVVCVVKRMGGGFGGKESQGAPFAYFAALVATRTGRAARLVLTKDDDMVMTGKRNPFEIDYTVGYDDEGRIEALDAKLYSDGGAYADLSTSIMERAMLHSDNAYFLRAARVVGQVCKTNVHPHTAFRGFGGPKGVAMIEGVLEDIAHALGIDPLDVRKRNVYSAGRDVTHYGQKLENNLLPALFDGLEARSDYRARRDEIRAFNARSKTHLRGISLTAVKFGISFTTRFLNQGNALVNVHQDGTVQLSTGATEMGQGVNTRIAMVVADCFGIALDRVRVMPTSTEKNHNTSPTAASAGTDLNARAALIACERIRARMAQIAVQLFERPEAQWPSRTAGLGTMPELELRDSRDVENVCFEDGLVFLAGARAKAIPFARLCREAFLSRVQLGDYGFFRTPGIYFDKLSGKGDPFFYFTQGVACSEVLIDRRTGELEVSRVDVLMDLGRPINAQLDVGQVTGAFVQGMGWCTTENLVYDDKGSLLSHSPSTYKIPSIQDTPRVFDVKLVENSGNVKNVHRTKAVGEPPLLLALSVWTAVKDALHHLAPRERALALPLPMTHERILLAADALSRG